jgi:hypothetical protein
MSSASSPESLLRGLEYNELRIANNDLASRLAMLSSSRAKQLRRLHLMTKKDVHNVVEEHFLAFLAFIV